MNSIVIINGVVTTAKSVELYLALAKQANGVTQLQAFNNTRRES